MDFMDSESSARPLDEVKTEEEGVEAQDFGKDQPDTSTGVESGESPADKAANEGEDEASRLQGLAATARDQDELERDIGRQADQMLLDQANERDHKRLEKTQMQKEKLVAQVRKLQQRLQQSHGSTSTLRIRNEIHHLQAQIEGLDTDLSQIQKRLDERGQEEAGENAEHALDGGNIRLPGESRRDFLIRTGKITPFSRFGGSLQKTSSSLADVMLDAEDANESEEEEFEDAEWGKPLSHRILRKPGFEQDESSQTDSAFDSVDDRKGKKRKLHSTSSNAALEQERTFESAQEKSGDDYSPDAEMRSSPASESGSEYPVMVQGDDRQASHGRKRKSKLTKFRKEEDDDSVDSAVEDLTGVDDGDEQVYLSRLRSWSSRRKAARLKHQRVETPQNMDVGANWDRTEMRSSPSNIQEAEEMDEWLFPHPTISDAEFEGGFRIPGDVYPSLFDYQKTGVQWLWELYSQQVGGIIGDEMGLGKTIQVIAFLAGLHHSKKLDKPILIVAPATVMKQWVNEFHTWWPPLRVSILHTSGSGMMNVRRERMIEDELELGSMGKTASSAASRSARKIVDRVVREGHVLVTTYSGLQTYAQLLLPVYWGYAVLDEGHKIRNPNVKITIYCKSLRTSNRVILSGTPMQNNLQELWSLFDFVFPLRLGNLVSFRTQFEIPIKQGGYANASNLQVETALKCAETLKDTISPYLLQRFKVDVAADLPKKSEQVLFCRLTKPQRDAYEAFLASSEMSSIFAGKRQALFGIDMLRKICNHPDLQDHKLLSVKTEYDYGKPTKSGKMQVVKALLELWRDTGHKTLLFTQNRIMLDILEKFVRSLGGFGYRRMDGNTQIKQRQDLVDEFNADPDIHVFLLTTKVGGLGVNLTGADRVIIYDPDWNPSTDVQARERAWRLGQRREVMIYRLMTAGTIEEKIYHRQIFKQFLTNKILRDPKQRQTFQLKDLHDLFTLGNDDEEGTETSGMFKGTQVHFDDAPPAAIEPDEGIPTASSQAEPEDANKIGSIAGISHREDFRPDEAPAKPPPETANNAEIAATSAPASGTSISPSKPAASNTSNPQLLSTIFARSGVHSALEHDAIINGPSNQKKVTADPEIIAQEAKKVAAKAARELQRAGEAARNLPAGIPTWTGIYGSAGRPEEPQQPQRGFSGRGGRGGRGGPSSSAVLANLSARQSSAVGGELGEDTQPSGADFISLIRDYLVAQGGAAYTRMLIDHFNRFCGTSERTAEFKEMLKQIAVLEKSDGSNTGSSRRAGRGGATMAERRREREERLQREGGRGRWILRREFGGTA